MGLEHVLCYPTDWCQHAWMLNKRGEPKLWGQTTHKRCLKAAIDNYYQDPIEHEAAIKRVIAAIDMLGFSDRKGKTRNKRKELMIIEGFNDHPDTDFWDVLKVIRLAGI